MVEVGAYETLAGFAGEDVPSCSFPSTAGFVPDLEAADAVWSLELMNRVHACLPVPFPSVWTP